MTTIRIADDPHPSHTIRSNTFASASGTDINDGVYSMRALSRATSMERRSRTSSRERQTTGLSEKDVEDEDPGLRRQGDFKEKQVLAQIPRLLYMAVMLTLFPGFQRQTLDMASIPVRWCDLRRHWYQPALRLLLNIQSTALL